MRSLGVSNSLGADPPKKLHVARRQQLSQDDDIEDLFGDQDVLDQAS